MTFDEWAAVHGCENCKKPAEERWVCFECKRKWLVETSPNIDTICFDFEE